ncbi:hypothetical protein [Aminobacter sp. BE322]|uniref:hypothetical protein n=1 Tax=unclassified Aminobacter TaxID=2644704 RepID=UPI003D1A7B6B
MKSSNLTPGKIDTFLNSLPQDRERKSLLRVLSEVNGLARPEEVYRAVASRRPLTAEQMSQTIKQAIIDGLVDVQGEGPSTRIGITPFGRKIAVDFE